MARLPAPFLSLGGSETMMSNQTGGFDARLHTLEDLRRPLDPLQLPRLVGVSGSR